MARTARKNSKGRARSRKSRTAARRRTAANGAGDAIALLKADHREVEGLFAEFEKSRSDSRKQELAAKICAALKAHTIIEEEIFYPAFLEATDDTEIHHEAEVEHDGAKKLIAEIEAGGPEDDYFDARISVLSEMIKHHVNEEEKRGGMFTKAKSAGMDLAQLGERLQARKREVMPELEADGGSRSRPGMRGRGRSMGGMSSRGAKAALEGARRH